MYFGQYKELDYYLVNNSPESFEFDVKFQIGHSDGEKNQFFIQTPH